MTLYTRVLVNVTKWTKSTHLAMIVSPSIYDKIKTSTLHPVPIQLRTDQIFEISMSMEKLAPPFCQSFWFGSDHGKKLYLVRALFILLNIGTHPGNMGEELVYYHLYHE